jgi:pretoxin HINT domain-containing protein
VLRLTTTTEHHPFWSSPRGRWADAGQLQAGELLRICAGTYIQLGAVLKYHSERVTYDLTVDAAHTYYVTAGNTSVLVHNCGKDQGIYEFSDQHNPGQTYVGTSMDLSSGLQRHLDSGQLASLDDVKITHVFGCEEDVYVAERLHIQRLRKECVSLSNIKASPLRKILLNRIQPMLSGAEDWF